MNSGLAQDLRQHLGLYREVLELTRRENQSLRDPDLPSQFDSYQGRKALLPRLEASVQALRRHRATWQQMSPAERSRHPEIAALLKDNQDLIMKILMLDRENEQHLLRRGLVPARQLPAAARQRPHFVADLYRRNGLASGNAD